MRDGGISLARIRLVATAAFALESVVAQELRDLGYDELEIENNQVTFWAEEAAIARCNLWLRVADRVRLLLGRFTAQTFDELFERTKALPWADWLPQNARFPVQGKSVRSQLSSVPDCQAVVKKAIVESLKQRYRQDWFNEDGPVYPIEVAILKDTVSLTIDTSGTALHKRGYRTLISEAPLKETLAAALIKLSYWDATRTFVDPFCGSGTLPIEAAMIGQNRAPGLQRTFAAEQWPALSGELWQRARAEAASLQRLDQPLAIIGTDIDGQVLKAARQNATAAGVARHIHFQEMEMSELQSSRKYGVVICNPPYGERLGDRESVERLYREMGNTLGQLETWSHYVLTAFPEFERFFGRRADRRRKLYNGDIMCQYYQYYGPRPPRE